MTPEEIYDQKLKSMIDAIDEECQEHKISYLLSMQIGSKIVTNCAILPEFGPVGLDLGAAAHLLTSESDQMTLTASALLWESAKLQEEQGSADDQVRDPG